MILSVFHDWFAWPDGAVLTNLVASAICVTFGIWRILKSHKNIHAKLDDLHAKHDLIHQHLGVGQDAPDSNSPE